MQVTFVAQIKAILISYSSTSCINLGICYCDNSRMHRGETKLLRQLERLWCLFLYHASHEGTS